MDPRVNLSVRLYIAFCSRGEVWGLENEGPQGSGLQNEGGLHHQQGVCLATKSSRNGERQLICRPRVPVEIDLPNVYRALLYRFSTTSSTVINHKLTTKWRGCPKWLGCPKSQVATK